MNEWKNYLFSKQKYLITFIYTKIKSHMIIWRFLFHYHIPIFPQTISILKAFPKLNLYDFHICCFAKSFFSRSWKKHEFLKKITTKRLPEIPFLFLTFIKLVLKKLKMSVQVCIKLWKIRRLYIHENFIDLIFFIFFISTFLYHYHIPPFPQNVSILKSFFRRIEPP